MSISADWPTKMVGNNLNREKFYFLMMISFPHSLRKQNQLVHYACLWTTTFPVFLKRTSCNPVLRTETVGLHRSHPPPPPRSAIGDHLFTWTVKCWLLILSMLIVYPPPPGSNIGNRLFTWKRQLPLHTDCKILIVNPPPTIDTKTALAFWTRFSNVKQYDETFGHDENLSSGCERWIIYSKIQSYTKAFPL